MPPAIPIIASEADRRNVEVALTEKGREAAEEVSMNLIQPGIMSQFVDDGVRGLNSGGIGNVPFLNCGSGRSPARFGMRPDRYG